MSARILTGKHSGRSYADVAECDRNYCQWILSTSSLPRSLLLFKIWLKRARGGILPYGKHKDKFYNEVYDEFPEYAVWACGRADLVGDTGHQLVVR